VDVPQCETSKGSIPALYTVMFNSMMAGAYKAGGELFLAVSYAVTAMHSLTG